MTNYRWQCLACESGNDATEKYCSICGCPVGADSGIAEGWGRALKEPPKKPTNIGHVARWGILGFQYTRTSPCPYCGLHMYIYDSTCPHCGFELSLIQRYLIIDLYIGNQSFGYKAGLKYFAVFFLIAVAIGYVAKNF
jgi:hypothetical protein